MTNTRNNCRPYLLLIPLQRSNNFALKVIIQFRQFLYLPFFDKEKARKTKQIKDDE